ncbi:MAG: sphingosine kinase, partial [Verrucomicrobiota bacterium]|nr:sphingosine kinase [Verrucomicrobiota bacterium]
IAIPIDIYKTIRTIVNGHAAEVDVGEVNGRTFINNSSLGIYPRIVARREAQQERLGRGKWPAFLWALLHALYRFPFLHLRIAIEGKQIDHRTAFLFIGNNEYKISGFKLGGRARLDAGRLGLYLTHRTGRLGLLRLAFNALIGRLNQEKDFDAFSVEEATIETRQSLLLVATDGEVTRMETPLHYRIRPRALRVLIRETPGGA